jgi:hypothetical protein
MANSETRSIVVLSAGKPVESQDSVEVLRTRLTEAPRGDFSFMVVTDTRGQEHWVNVREIVQIHEPPQYGSASFS